MTLSKHDRRLRIQALIWEEWREGRDNPSFDAMSMKERDELLDRYREKLRTKVKYTGKPLVPKVDKAEMQRLAESFKGTVTKVREGDAVARMIAVINDDFLEKE